jgi:tRNA(Ile)-lysidine synthase
MIHLNCKLHFDFGVAVSGGVDSMAALDFLRKNRGLQVVLHYNHATPGSAAAERLVTEYCKKHNLQCIVGNNTGQCPKGRSLEDWWREIRYAFFEEATDLPVITCHHLNDAVETWLWTSLHGNPRVIPPLRGKYVRPFLTTTKSDFVQWASKRNVPYTNDESNNNIGFIRNYIRHELMPHALHVNPGIAKVVKKKIYALV